MDSTGFSSPRPECFPAGLRVLVVDDDPTWLKILEKMLKKCNYEVTTCNLARDALDLLRERKDGFDIVISDVNMPDMDGFKLLEHVGLEMDLPVIMMSVDGETSRVMKGVQHGACDYLLKPIRMKELRNIWQHVFRKRIHEVRDIEGYESLEEIQMMRNAAEMSDDSFLFSGDFVSGKKRKDAENKHNDGESSSGKKARVVWTVELHQKFVKAVNQIGFDKVGPKKILDLMGVPWLTRENVASHLQKYRLYLTRLQKESELKATFGGTKHSDIASKELPVNVCLHNSITKNATALPPNILADENYAVSGQKIPVLHDEPKLCETNTKVAALPMSMADSKSSTSRISYDHRSFGPLDSDVKPEPKIQPHYSWSTPTLQFKQEHKTRFQENGLDHLPRPIHHIQISPVKTSLVHNTGLPNKDSGKPTQAGLNPSFDKSNIDKLAKAASSTSLFPVQPESHHAAIDPIPSPYDVPEYSQRNLTASTGPAIRLWDEGFFDYSSQVEFYPPNPYPGSFDPLGYANQDLIADVPLHLYDTLRFDSEFAGDMVEYPVIDQGVFIA